MKSLIAAALLGLAAAGAAHAQPARPPIADHGISGLWMVINPQQFPEDAPLTPQAKALNDIDNRMVADGLVVGERSAKCLPVANPAMMVNEFALNLLEGPGQIMIVSENNPIPRILYTDGRSHAGSETDYGWNGHSIAHWEGEVLVVDTTSFNDRYAVYKGATLATHRTSALHMSERFWIENDGQVLVDDMIIDDPGAFTAPVRNTIRYRRLVPPQNFMEDACEVQVEAILANEAWRKKHLPKPPE